MFLSGFLVWAVSLVPPGLVGQSLASGPADKPRDDAPWQRLLTGDDAKQVEDLDRKVAELSNAGRYAEAQVPARAILALRTRVQGATHWQTANAKRELVKLQQIAALPAAAQADLTEAQQLDRERSKLRQQGRYREAIPIAERIVTIWQRHLGEEHSEVATALSNQAFVVENGPAGRDVGRTMSLAELFVAIKY